MSGNARESGRSTTSRVLALLAAFSRRRPELTLTELAALSGLPPATTHRLAAELLDWGALERAADGRFQVGLRLWEIGALTPAHRELRSAAIPFMEDLYEATHENVQLAVRDGLEVLFVDKISGDSSVVTLTDVGGRAPLHATAVGKIILAFSEPELFAEVAGRELPRSTPHTITLPSVLAQALRAARRDQVAYSLEERSLGASSVAAPVRQADGTLVAALSVVARSSKNVRGLAFAVRTAALGLSRRLAGQGSA
ncbi:IclR family transcriptional regulator [Allokutzneria sp. A3M-2-11 16]|uniref:IclR family transcriptional regulator n=1 Tax=Allokutzneria sp. A3M-2-11 16 TaxID=2962043 RepID=UPI0020B7CE59|nr:IclR family transcriptional regulator [Allokutzneria sp. A3M-2-11 16]MCP3805085.1 IclR family transcriptional regulator [Allokutzneria sp. A3M-2-11 16]